MGKTNPNGQLWSKSWAREEKMTAQGTTHEPTTNVRNDPGSPGHGGHKVTACRMCGKRHSGGLVTHHDFYTPQFTAAITSEQLPGLPALQLPERGPSPTPNPEWPPESENPPLREQSC